MIADDILTYLQTKPSLVSALGGIDHIVYIQPLVGAKMPWLIVMPSGGSEMKNGAVTSEGFSYIRIYVDVGPAQKVRGQQIAEIARGYLNNLRGSFGTTTEDALLTCSAVNGYPGLDGATRYTFDITAKHILPYATQRPS